MRHHTQHRFSERLDGGRNRKFFIFGEIQDGFPIFRHNLGKIIALPSVQNCLECGSISLLQQIEIGVSALGGGKSREPTGFTLSPGRWRMQIRGPDLVLSASWNRKVGGAKEFPHLLGQAEFPEVFGGVRLRCINSLAPFIRKKVSRSICRELASPLCIHPFERLNGGNDRFRCTCSGEGECHEDIWEEGAEK